MIKAIVFGLAASGASSLLFIPLLVSANFVTDFLQKTASNSNASDISFNSQTLPLLAAATNFNPNPALASGPELVAGEALQSQDNPVSPGDLQMQPTNSQINVYTVRVGDTLSGIASQFGVSTNTIIGTNDIQNGVIHPGQELVILPITGIQHKVVEGETLASLAKKYGSNAHDIALYNNLADDQQLSAGTNIIIPSAEANSETIAAPTTPKLVVKVKTTAAKSTPKVARKSSGAPYNPLKAGVSGPEYDGYYAWPVAGGIITQGLHGYNGVDIGAPSGTDIYAAAAGTVIVAKFNGGWNGGYGNYVVVEHDNGTQSLYAHMSKVLASPGDSVTQGELIGRVGRTGEATGNHLHFEIRGATNPFGAIPVGSGE